MSNLLKKLTLVTGITMLISCGGNGNCPPNTNDNGNAATLQVITPKNIYSKIAEATTGYVVVKNPTAQPVKNLHYSLSNLIGSGSNVSIDDMSSKDCAIVAAYSQCSIKLNVPANAVAGSFAFNFNNTDKVTTRSLQYSVNSLMQIGIEQAHYNETPGPDGISINYYHTVIAGIPYILVNGIVASNNTGTFNKIVLVNNQGVALPNQQIISGGISSAQGATFSILLPVPTGDNSTQTFKLQTQLIGANGEIIAEENSTTSNTVSTSTGIGIADMLPEAVYLTTDNPEQTITFANTGDNIAQLQRLIASEPNIEVSFTSQQLSSGATATATLKLINTTVGAKSGSMLLNYNDGKTEKVVAGDINQNIAPQPTPTPTPTPTPPAPTAGLTTVLTPDNDFFTTTVIGTVSRQLTLTNTGNTTESNFVLNLPANFTISTGNSNSCNVTKGSSPATISDSLVATTGSCSITVNYNNSTVTTQAAGNISISYDYNNGTNAPTPTLAAINYRVTQSSANLSLTPSTTQNYGSILNNNSESSQAITYTLTNSGEVSATNLAFNITGTDASLFHVMNGGTCVESGVLSSTVGSNTCTIKTQFGVVPNGTSTGNKTASFDVGYTPYSGGNTVNTSDVNLSGNVTAAPSASFTNSITANTFISGNGTLATPYTGNVNSNYTLSVTYTNTSTNISAESFTTSSAILPSGWSLTNHGCNNISMSANGGTCIDVYTLNSSTSGSHDINLANVTASWSDSNGTYTEQAVSGVGIISTYLEAAAVPNIVLVAADADLPMGSAYAFKATITGGSSTFTPTVSGLGNSVASPSSCALDDANPESASCIFIIAPYSGIGEYSYWNPSVIDNSLDVSAQSIAYQSTGIGFTFTATNSATILGRPSPFIIPSTGNSSYAPYIYLPAVKPGLAAVVGTGITWPDEGRFIAGTQAGGGTCYDAFKDTLTGLEWKAELTNTTYSWENAQNYASSLSTCGQSDWRIPTINELRSLVNYGAQPPYYTSLANWLAAQNFVGIRTDTNYWSATPFSMSGNPQAFTINFNEGNMAFGGVTAPFPVWPVRGGE